MVLKKLFINRGWGTKGPLRGEIEFATNDGEELKMMLDEQLSIEIVKLCADAIIRSGQRAAQAITADALATTAIEHQPDD